MLYRGHVENGLIRLEGAVTLPEGAEVRVEVVSSPEKPFRPNGPTIEEKLAAIVAGVPKEEWGRLPPDVSDDLDHYIYATRK